MKMSHIEQLQNENHKLLQELIQAMANHDDQQIDVIHELMMTNKELMIKIEAMGSPSEIRCDYCEELPNDDGDCSCRFPKFTEKDIDKFQDENIQQIIDIINNKL